MSSIKNLVRKAILNPASLLVCIALLVSGCGGGSSNSDPNLNEVGPNFSPTFVRVKLGETARLTVDIYEVGSPSTGVTVAGFNIDMPEVEARIDITTANCPSGTGTPSCQEWIISPALDATPGTYEILVEPASPSTLVNTRSQLLFLVVEANPLLYSAPAGIAVYGSDAASDNFNRIHSVRTTDNRRWAWSSGINGNYFASAGVNSYPLLPELTPGVMPSSVSVAALDPLTNWIDMDFSNSFGLGVSEAGQVLSWGAVSTSLGIPREDSDGPQRLPTTIPGLSGASEVAVASISVLTFYDRPNDSSASLRTFDARSFALINGEIHFWGDISFPEEEPAFGVVEGQIGQSQESLTGIVEIDAGAEHMLALRDDGSVWGWGDNSQGQLGNGITDETDVAESIPQLQQITSIAANRTISLAVDQGGRAYAWGSVVGSTPTAIDGFSGAGDGEKSATDIAPYALLSGTSASINTQHRAALISEIDSTLWIWDADLNLSSRIPGLTAFTLGPGFAIDSECGTVTTPNGVTTESGFVWDISVFPEEPPVLLPIFGKNDPTCPDRLFVSTQGQGAVSVSPEGTDVRTLDCEADICQRSYGYGSTTSVQLTATPADGWVLDPANAWGGSDECSEASDVSSLSVTVQGGTQCIARFVEADSLFALSIGVTGNGQVTDDSSQIDCPGSCMGTFADGTTIALSPVADSGWTFDSWQGDPVCAEGFTIRADTSCTAVFVEAVNLTMTVLGNGSVTSTPVGISCPGDCSEVFSLDTVVDLQPQADAGWAFNGWSGDPSCGNQITMTADTLCTAEFTEMTTGDVTLTLTILGGPGAGQVRSTDALIPTMDCINSATPETICIATFASGTLVELIPEAFGTGQADVQWTGCDMDIGIEGCTLTMNTDRSVTATFVSTPSGNNPPQIVLSILPNAGVTTETVVTFDASNSVDLDGTIDPVNGYLWDFDSDGVVDDTGSTATYTYPAEGEYIVTLEVIDDDGASTVETNRVVRVENATMTLTILGGPNAGRVNSSDGPSSTMDCTNLAELETTCTAIFPPGLGVFLIPSPTVGGGDVQWTGCDSEIGIEGCSVAMNGDRTLTASFIPPP